MVVVEALKEKALSSLVRELWTLRTMLVRAQKEMRSMVEKTCIILQDT